MTILVDLLVQRCRRQLPGSLGCLRPQPLDRVPERADVIGRLALAELHALGVPPVQLSVDEIGHVDAVDRDVAEVAGDAHIHQPAVPDRDAGHIAVGEPGAA
jgi:hypothetical protein